MVYTFRDLQDNVLRKLDESANDTTREVVKDLLNLNQQVRIGSEKWSFMKRRSSFATVANQEEYTLSPEYARPLWFRNATSGQPLVEVPNGNIAASGVRDLATTSKSGQFFQFIEKSPVKNQPAAAGVVTIVSSSAVDVGADYAVVVKGELVDGDNSVDYILPNGTTAVAGVIPFLRILEITKEQDWNGVMTVTSGATTLVTLSPWEMGKSYQMIRFFESPTGGETIEYEFFRQALEMINDYDKPAIPDAHALILVYDTLLDLSDYVQDIPSQALQRWEEQQREMELNLYAAFAESQTLDAQSSTIRLIDPA